jgi:hypothetical protein
MIFKFLPHTLQRVWQELEKKFGKFHGNRRFITAFTRARHLSLNRDRSIQSMPRSHFFKVHYNIILPYTPRSSKWSLSLFPAKPCMHFSCLPYVSCSFHYFLYKRMTSNSFYKNRIIA